MTSTNLSSIGGPCRVTFAGEIDLENAADYLALAQAILARCKDDHLIVDLSGVTFIDSTGIGMLLEVRAAAADAGKQLHLHGTPGRVQRVLEIAGLTDLVEPTSPGGRARTTATADRCEN